MDPPSTPIVIMGFIAVAFVLLVLHLSGVLDHFNLEKNPVKDFCQSQNGTYQFNSRNPDDCFILENGSHVRYGIGMDENKNYFLVTGSGGI